MPGLRSAHRGPDGRFYVPWEPFPIRLRDVLRWQLTRWVLKERRAPDASELQSLLATSRRQAVPRPRATWVGQATVILEDGEDLVILDPHWGRRALVARRLRPPSPPLECLPTPRFVVLSHDHYDHLDVATVRRLRHVPWVVPQGLRGWMTRHGVVTVHELDWWQSQRLGDWELHCLPAQHWSKRLEHGRNSTLWASWLLRGPSRTVYFGGDSGYFAGYAEIAARFPDIDLAILPIGAFAPRWFMQWQHLDPQQTAQAWRDLGAKRLLPVHWGTFDLADDHPDQAPVELIAALAPDERERVDLLAVGSTAAY